MISKKDNIMEFTTLFLSNVHEKYLELKKKIDGYKWILFTLRFKLYIEKLIDVHK